MILVNVRLDIERAKRKFRGREKEVAKAALRALDRVGVTARKAADQEMRTRLTLKSAVIKNALDIKAPMGRLRLIRDIEATGDPIPLRDYQARTTRKGATFAVVKGQRKRYQRKGRPGFQVKRIGNHVFVRTSENPPGPPKAPISKVYGPGIAQRFRVKRVQQAMQKAINERWPIEFAREIKYRMSK